MLYFVLACVGVQFFSRVGPYELPARLAETILEKSWEHGVERPLRLQPYSWQLQYEADSVAALNSTLVEPKPWLAPYAVDPYFNFLTFGNAVLTLFRVASGDQWYDVMLAFMARHPECTTEQQSYEELLAEGPKNCGDYLSTLAFFFFTVFTVQYVSMNLFVGCVIDGYLEVMPPLIPWPSFTSFP